MKRFFLFIFIITFMASFAIAQVTEPIEVDVSKAADVFYMGIAGIGVLGIVEILKRKLKTTGLVTILVSIIVSAGATLYYLLTTQGFDLLKFIIFTVVVALAANGIYLFPKKREA